MMAMLLLLAAAPAEPMRCDGSATQIELTMCAHAEFETVDAELNAQWPRATAYMKQRDRELEKDDTRPKHFDTLLAAQRAWLSFRDQQCLLEGFSMRGGSAEPQVNSACKAKLTRARTAQLKSLIETGN